MLYLLWAVLCLEQGWEPVFVGLSPQEGGDQDKLEFKTFVLHIEREGEGGRGGKGINVG